MGPDHLDALVVGAVGAHQRLDAQRGGDVDHLHQQVDLVDGQRQQHLHRLGAVDQAEPFLRGERQRLEALLREQLSRRPAGEGLACAAQPALADERLGEVRELAEVAAGADRALAGDHREQVAVEHVEQPSGQVGADAAVADGERAGAQAAAGRVRRRRAAARRRRHCASG